jgi:methylmalonyl-CoA mutase
MHDLLKERNCGHIKIFGGGGGTILPTEIEELHQYGITKIYSPDDGRTLGLEGMIEEVVNACDFETVNTFSGDADTLSPKEWKSIAQLITLAENGKSTVKTQPSTIPVLGITGTGGAGKSSVTDEIVRRFLKHYTDKTIAVISVDPSKKKTGGALLGDRIRMNSISNPRAYMRSLATRESDKALSVHVQEAIDVCKAAHFDFIILESAGTGQSDASILDYCNVSLLVMTPEYGAATQLEKINMLDYADVIAINKFDKAGALDALADVRKQYKRSHNIFQAKDEEVPVVGTIASQFNDAGVNHLFELLMHSVSEKMNSDFKVKHTSAKNTVTKSQIIPPARVRYLAEIAENNERYDEWVNEQCAIATKLYQLNGIKDELKNSEEVSALLAAYQLKLAPENWKLIAEWSEKIKKYSGETFAFQVRDKVLDLPFTYTSLSGTNYSQSVFAALQRLGRYFEMAIARKCAGRISVHSRSVSAQARRRRSNANVCRRGRTGAHQQTLSLCIVRATCTPLVYSVRQCYLYGEDPDHRPDIYGKVGNSGVSIATVDDAKKLYSGFDLCSPKTSVSMTINGPAPMVLAFFMNAAIDQECEKYIKANGLEEQVKAQLAALDLPKYNGELPNGNNGLGLQLLGLSGSDVLPKDVYEQLKAKALSSVRGTVQADILKEDQAQNTCIFSTEFALKMMGDVQEYFIQHKVQNFYSVSISGYHIAEAGANPITQLAFTLSNGFTYVEYYLSRGMKIDDFAPNLSFFFSNGMDPEYSVIGRVARRIWAKAMKQKYKGNDRSQKLKYHIQTSGRSLHAQEIDFNDIRTTLQALYAIYDNCNSLHTNAYDEAITTPTEESVRRAMAIQLIINRELGTAKNENPNQGSFLIEELTDLVEEAVLTEFKRLTERGGVLGAMERMYQRNKIQEESMFYEHQKHTGEFPIVGVNTFLSKNGSPTIIPTEVIRSTTEEKEFQIST